MRYESGQFIWMAVLFITHHHISCMSIEKTDNRLITNRQINKTDKSLSADQSTAQMDSVMRTNNLNEKMIEFHMKKSISDSSVDNQFSVKASNTLRQSKNNQLGDENALNNSKVQLVSKTNQTRTMNRARETVNKDRIDDKNTIIDVGEVFIRNTFDGNKFHKRNIKENEEDFNDGLIRDGNMINVNSIKTIENRIISEENNETLEDNVNAIKALRTNLSLITDGSRLSSQRLNNKQIDTEKLLGDDSMVSEENFPYMFDARQENIEENTQNETSSESDMLNLNMTEISTEEPYDMIHDGNHTVPTNLNNTFQDYIPTGDHTEQTGPNTMVHDDYFLPEDSYKPMRPSYIGDKPQYIGDKPSHPMSSGNKRPLITTNILQLFPINHHKKHVIPIDILHKLKPSNIFKPIADKWNNVVNSYYPTQPYINNDYFAYGSGHYGPSPLTGPALILEKLHQKGQHFLTNAHGAIFGSGYYGDKDYPFAFRALNDVGARIEFSDAIRMKTNGSARN